MGYFANGTEGMIYEDKYCDHCKRMIDGICPIWDLHQLHNYNECNNKDSMLHELIPVRNTTNLKCNYFVRE